MTDQLRKDLAGSDTSNDMSECVFAVFTNALKEFRKIRWTIASALAQNSINHDVCLRCRPVTSRARSRAPAAGPSCTTPPPMRLRLSSRWPAPTTRSCTRRTSARSSGRWRWPFRAWLFQVTRKLRLTAAKFGKSLE